MTQQNELEFQQLANKFMGDKFEERIMKAHFGVSISTITKIWSYIAENRHNVRKNHLLWTMHFLKVNPKDDVNLFKEDIKTVKKWVWITVDLLNKQLPQVLYTDHSYLGIQEHSAKIIQLLVLST